MAMVACPECGKELSDAAPACPSCGKPNVKAQPKRSVGILLGLGVLIAPLIFAWFTLRKGHTTTAKVVSFAWLVVSLPFFFGAAGSRAPTSVARSSAPAPAEVQVIQVQIHELLSDYKNNEVSADNKYKGKWVQTTGAVGDIKKDIVNSLYVTLGTGRDFEIPRVQAFFADSMNNQLAGLRKGQQLSVTCRIEGLMMNVLGKDCVIQ